MILISLDNTWMIGTIANGEIARRRKTEVWDRWIESNDKDGYLFRMPQTF